MACEHKGILAVYGTLPSTYTCTECGESCVGSYCHECGEQLPPFDDVLLCANCQLVPEPEE